MAYKERTSLDADVTTPIGGVNKKTGKKNPSQIEGYYLGSREVESKKSKNGKAQIHFLQTSKGNVGVWGKTDLDRKLDGVEPGCMIRITHTGMQSTPNGDMYKYKVEVDDENTIEVSAASSDSSSDDTEEYDGNLSQDLEDNQGYDSEDTEESEEDVAQLAAAKQAAASRAAKVQSLLKKKV